jgi:hypothetical protein
LILKRDIRREMSLDCVVRHREAQQGKITRESSDFSARLAL